MANNITIQIESLEDESVQLITWEGLQSVSLTMFLLICAMINFGGKGMIINYIKNHAQKGRPINFMFIKDQVLQLVTIGVVLVLTTTSILHGSPISEIYGHGSCWIFWVSSIIHNNNLGLGGLSMSIFRLICVSNQHLALNIKLAKNISKKIIMVEFFIGTIMVILAFVAIGLSDITLAMEFCRGHSREVSTTLAKFNGYRENDIKLGIKILAGLSFSGLLMIIAEFFIYAYLFWILYRKDSKNLALDKTMRTKKFKRNAITLSGQTMSFLVEVFSAFALQGLLHFRVGGIQTTIYPILQIVLATGVTISHLAGSAEFKRHYFNFDV